MKIRVLIADYCFPLRILNAVFDDKRFEFYSYSKASALYKSKKLKGLSRRRPRITEAIAENKIDVVIGTDPSINSFQNAPFSIAARKCGVPYVNMFDGIVDYTVSNPDRSTISKIWLGLKLIKDDTFKSFIKSYLYNNSFFSFAKYMLYSVSSKKNRYQEHGITNYINGSKALEMYGDKLKKSNYRLMGLLQMDGLVSKEKKAKEKKGRVLIIGQPLIRDKIINQKEQDEFLKEMNLLAEKNKDKGFTFVYRLHPADNPEEYKALNTSLVKIQDPRKGDLDEEIQKAEFVIGYFSTAIANGIYFHKKMIIVNLYGRFSNSIYINEPCLYHSKNFKSIDFKKIKKFYTKKRLGRFDKFFKSINYYVEGETCRKRFINSVISLVKEGK